MRDIHVIYADSNSADFAGFKNRLLLKWSQCKHSKKGTVRRDWNDVDNRNGRDVLEKRQRRETEGAVFETRGTGKEDGLDVLPQERDGRLERDRQRSRERRVLLQVILRDSSAFFEVIHHKCKLIGQTKTDPSLSDPFPCAYYETLLMSTALASVVRGYVYRMSRRLRMRDIHAFCACAA